MQEETKTFQTSAVVIVAAGRGTRMGESLDGPKQYAMIGEKTVLQRTIECFEPIEAIHHIIVVIHRDDHDMFASIPATSDKLLPPVEGGETRQESAYLGLKALAELRIDKVMIHDAARPFVDEATILKCLDGIEPGKCALPALAVSDTIKRAEADNGAAVVSKTIPREGLYLAQTPQGFLFDEIASAHKKAVLEGIEGLTDDTAVGEWSGMTTILVDGNRQNIKITTIEDLENARKMSGLKETPKIPDVRTGNGYDLHRLVAGDGVILCGVTIPSQYKLDGHSDADVGLHALTDALLGAIGAGDIGSHFPPTDPKWKGAKSDQFLAQACQLVRKDGGIITHCDVSIICEAPKVGPYREEMRAEVAKICAIDIGRVGVKATTNERIGAIGRGEGIAALATATVVFP